MNPLTRTGIGILFGSVATTCVFLALYAAGVV